MNSPVVTLVVLALGVALIALLLAGLTNDRRPDGSTFLGALVLVVVATLGTSLVGQVRGNASTLAEQRRAYASTYEEAARSKCLIDQGRQELVEGLDFVRRHVPDDGRFLAVPSGRALPCIYFNLLPRRHVPAGEFDPARHWIVYQQEVPQDVQRAGRREQRLPPDQRRHFVLSGSVAVIAPEDPAAR